jgi:hypothetical protein
MRSRPHLVHVNDIEPKHPYLAFWDWMVWWHQAWIKMWLA